MPNPKRRHSKARGRKRRTHDSLTPVALADCPQCHEANHGVTDAKCLDCHDHKPLKDELAKHRGLHATFTGPCLRCHPEHKGREFNIIDWKHVGGHETFNHTQTGLSLINDHAKVA